MSAFAAVRLSRGSLGRRQLPRNNDRITIKCRTRQKFRMPCLFLFLGLFEVVRMNFSFPHSITVKS